MHRTTSTSHVPRKRFGQHFLHDPGILRKIVQAIAPKPGENLLEIGPGRRRADAAAAARARADDRDRARSRSRAAPSRRGRRRRHPRHRQRRRAHDRFVHVRSERAAAHRRQPALQHLLADPVPLHRAHRCDPRHAFHVAERSRRAHGRGARQQGLRAPVGDAAACLPRRSAAARAGRRIPASAESRVRGRSPDAARTRRAALHRRGAARAHRQGRIRPAAQDARECAAAISPMRKRFPMPASIRAHAPSSLRQRRSSRWRRRSEDSPAAVASISRNAATLALSRLTATGYAVTGPSFPPCPNARARGKSGS